jgi:hypothetical protein
MWPQLLVHLLGLRVEDRASEVFNASKIKLVLESFS